MDIVTRVLEQTSQEAQKYKSITVNKHLELELDLGSLLAVDNNDLDKHQLKNNINDYILNLTRDNTQLLLNKVWELQCERVEEAIVVKLPKPTFVLPRAQRVPKPKPLTKWQQFAKEKGITKKKKSKLSWDEELQKWVPLYGYRRAVAEREKDWLIEVPDNVESSKDLFSEKKTVKSERIAKNELHRLRNIAKQKGVKLPRVGLSSTDVLNASELNSAATVAKSSTASVGKFQSSLPKEKLATKRGVAEITPGVTRKRKMPPVSLKEEHKQNLSTIESIFKRQPLIDIDKAVNKQIFREEKQKSEENQLKPGQMKKKKNVKGGYKKGKVGRATSKPKGNKGQRNFKKRTIGHKRR